MGKVILQVELEGNLSAGEPSAIAGNIQEHIFEEGRCGIPGFKNIKRCRVKIEKAEGIKV